MRFSLAALLCLVLPSCKVKFFLLRLQGWTIGKNCRIGHSLINCPLVIIEDNVSIGSFNLISINKLILRELSTIGHLNKITGPLTLALEKKASLGNENRVIRAAKGVSWGRSMLRLKFNSKITSGHIIDCTRPIVFLSDSILAGRGSQLWTHGYLHAPEGSDRFRIDGSIHVGANVYIGSACIINASVRICNGATLGAGSCISRSIVQPGLYVGQALRFIPMNYMESYHRYPTVRVNALVETVKIKKR